jgi:tetratricopeptide (TPR) repeat protein
MNLYYSQMVGAIDLVKEDARLSKVDFRKAPAEQPVVKTAPPPPPPALTGAAKMLADAEQLYKENELGKAEKLFLSVLEKTDEKPMHAAAYYGLARVAARQKNPETAERMFQKTMEMEPEPFVKAWTLVYLGRLSMAAQDGGPQAIKYFQQALEVQGASDEARKAAQQGLQQVSK